MAITDGIVGCWSPSLGASGYRLLDRSGRGNHGTLTNMDAGTDWVGTSQGLSLDFDGSNDYVSFGQSPISGSQSRTVTAWSQFYAIASSGVNRMIYSAGAVGSVGQQFEFGQSGSGNWYFQGYSANASFSAGDTLWHLHCVSYTGSTLQWWIDGVSIGTASLSLNTDGSAHGLARDIVFNGSFLFGRIGEVGIYNRALTAAEVRDLYRRGNGAIGRELTGQTRRRTYGFVAATGARRRRILCGDYS